MKTIEQLLSDSPNFTKSVVAFLLDEDKVLLGKRIKVSNGLGQDLIAGIGGKLEAGEINEDALVRELEEEILVTPTKWNEMGHVKFLFPHKPKWQQDVAIFLVNEWQGQPKKTDVIDPIWFDTGSIPYEQMWDDNYYWLPKILDGEKVNSVYLYDDSLNVEEEVHNPDKS